MGSVGAHKVVVRGIQCHCHAEEFCAVAVGEFARGDASLARRLRHLDAVLVRASQKEYVLTVEPLETCHGVGRDQLTASSGL